MKTIIYINGDLTWPLGEWVGTSNIQQISLIEPETVIFYVIKETIWIRYNSQMSDIVTRCDPN